MKKLKYFRYLLGINQAELSLKTGIDQSTISRIESGLRRPTSEQKRQLAGALGVDSSLLFPEE